jgi:hypothetical protein
VCGLAFLTDGFLVMPPHLGSQDGCTAKIAENLRGREWIYYGEPANVMAQHLGE